MTSEKMSNRSTAFIEPTEVDVSPIDDVRASSEETSAAIEPDRLAAEREALALERERLGRALRELEASKVRVERDAQRVLEETKSSLVSQLLPVLDNFDRAIAVAASNGDAPAVVEGARMVHRQLDQVLEGYGLARFDAVGARFDPSVHDATHMIPVDDPARDGTVIEQLQPGYMFGARLLRAANVIVGRYTPSAA